MSPGAALWLRVRARSPSGGNAPALTRALLDLGGRAVQEEGDGTLVTYVPVSGDPQAAKRRVRRSLADRADPGSLDLDLVDGRDWRIGWTRGLEPRRVGERLLVVPAGPEDVVLRLEPGMAFGTGDHGTTRGALALLEPVAPGAGLVLDVGTGTGVLAVAALALGAGRAVALDPSPEAIEAAARHAGSHGVDDRLQLVRMAAGPEVLRLLAPPGFDLVLANLDRTTLAPLLAPLGEVLAEGGRLVVSGILESEAEAFREEAVRAGLAVERETVDDGWWSARLRRA